MESMMDMAPEPNPQPGPDQPSPEMATEDANAMVANETPAFEEFADLSNNAADAAPPSLAAVYDVPVKVQAVLGRTKIPVGDLLQLRSGMVVELDRRVGEPVDVFVNNRLVARGEVVMVDQALGITLTEIVRPDR